MAGLRVFVVAGEPSGDMLAAALVTAVRGLAPQARFSGIGNERMALAGVELTTRTTGWASLGPLAALVRIPRLLFIGLRHVALLMRSPCDLLVLVDFGAFNVRLAQWLRSAGYRKPILYFIPPGAWLDKPAQARAVARVTTPLTAFAHQRDFYASLGLPIAYFGHPLVSLVPPRSPRPRAPADGGVVALLPGSRRGEIERHMGPLLGACRVLRSRRANVEFLVSAANAEAEGFVTSALAVSSLTGIRVVRGAEEAFAGADAAWIASGTAVLEATLREVPAVALYVILPALVAHARRIWPHRYITLPNILLEREVVPEYLQEEATPERLAAAVEALLSDPSAQLRAMKEVRAVLGPADALERCAAFALDMAMASRASDP